MKYYSSARPSPNPGERRLGDASNVSQHASGGSAHSSNTNRLRILSRAEPRDHLAPGISAASDGETLHKPLQHVLSSYGDLQEFLVIGVSMGRREIAAQRALDNFDQEWRRVSSYEKSGGGSNGPIFPSRPPQPKTSTNQDSQSTTEEDGDNSDTDSLQLPSLEPQSHHAQPQYDRDLFAGLVSFATVIYTDWREKIGRNFTDQDRGQKQAGERAREDQAGKGDGTTGGNNHDDRQRKYDGKGKGKAKQAGDTSKDHGAGEDGGGGGGGGGGGDRRQPRVDPARRLLACPFYKFDRIRHSGCLRFGLRRTNDVKQHLRRAHVLPLFCSSCGQVFPEQDECYEHTRRRACEAQEFTRPSGITATQIQQLSTRVPPRSSLEEQWYEIWEIVFPRKQRPASPFVDNFVEEILNDLPRFWHQHSPQIIEGYLDSRQRLTNSDRPPLGVEIDSNLVRLIGDEVIQRTVRLRLELADRNTAQGQAAPSTSRNTDSPGSSSTIPEASDMVMSSAFVLGEDDGLFDDILSGHLQGLSEVNFELPDETHFPSQDLAQDELSQALEEPHQHDEDTLVKEPIECINPLALQKIRHKQKRPRL